MDINLELYKVFYYVAKEKSFSKAAEKLFVTQPAISQAISQLESKLEHKLIIRHTRGISLTEAGVILFSHVEPAFNIINTGEIQLDELKDLKRGSISISASDTICMYFLPQYLSEFKNMFPEMNIKIANRTTVETIDILKRGAADIGIINIPEKLDGRIKVWKKIELNECFIAGEAYKELKYKSLSLNDISRYKLILLEKGTSTRNFADKFFAENGVKLEPEIELGSVDLLLKFTSIGMGISCVTKEYLIKSEYSEKLHILNTDVEFPKRYLGIISIKEHPLSRGAKAFLNMML